MTKNISFLKCLECNLSLDLNNKVFSKSCGHYICEFCLKKEVISQKHTCSICKLQFQYSNTTKLLELLFNLQIGEIKKIKEYCLVCKRIVINNTDHTSHELLSFDQFLQKANLLKAHLQSIAINKQKIKEGLLKIQSSFHSKLLKDLILKRFTIFLSENKDKVENPNEKLLFFKNREKNQLLNTIIKKCFLEGLRALRANKKSKELAVIYKSQTKTVFIFNSVSKSLETFNINQLPFTFFKSSHAIDVDGSNVYIVGGKQDCLLYSSPSNNIWKFCLQRKSLELAGTLPNPVSNSRCIFIGDSLYILGGENKEKYLSAILKVNFSPFQIKEITHFNEARSSFNLLVVNGKQLYSFFGKGSNAKQLTSVEIINVYSSNKPLFIDVEKIKCDNLLNGYILYNPVKEFIVIFGGQSQIKLSSDKISIVEKSNYCFSDQNIGQQVSPSIILGNHLFILPYFENYFFPQKVLEYDMTLELVNCYSF